MKLKYLAALLSLLATGPVWADITIGVTVSATGPAAALGGPQKNTASLLPSSLAGEKIHWIVFDDATDPASAAKNATRFVTEDHVDIIIGSSTTANTAAMVDIITEAKTPLLSLSPIDLPADKGKWVFRLPQHNALMARALIDHMKKSGVKTVGFIGFADVYGESWLKTVTPMFEAAGIGLVDTERFNRTDTSVTGQVLKLLAANPDAVLVVASGTPAALPHTTLVERGYTGKIYQTHGAPSKAFLQVGGKSVENGVFVVGPLLVWEQLPDTAPTKRTAAEYAHKYEEKFGAGSLSSFGGHLWDAWLLTERAVPVALKKAKPGTEAFRSAVRDALESEKEVVGVHAVFNMSPSDHFGHDERARVLVRAENGHFLLINEK
ncbi:MAG TPA: ABC transporter substrate-binding protein [Burkholderiaceae bacterium]|nr:ABC transporter substrate-binding protein [Burkholderiaceae bacterium]